MKLTLILIGMIILLGLIVQSNDIKTLQNHTNILAHKVQDLTYMVDVLTDLQKQMK